MPDLLLLRTPSANRVYAGEAAALSAAELEICAPFTRDIADVDLAGVGYLGFVADELTEDQLAIVSTQSTAYALYEREGALLRPLQLPDVEVLDEDLITIPKYQGKTNEQFTRLLLNVTLASVQREADGPRQVLDPLAGRGTTLSSAMLLGHDGFGVEADEKAFEQMAAFHKTWLRRKRIKHTADITPVRRDGKAVGKRFDATIRLEGRTLQLTSFTGDTRDSADLFGKKKFDAIVTDAPYGVVHGSTTDVRGGGKRDRTPARLLKDAVGVWSSQLKHGGALGLSWNTFGLSREDLAELLQGAGLIVRADGPWERFAHRVDASIRRDLVVAVKP
ncbi:MAG: site-specific DNA-methyltransferase [Propionibacteriaceae bacterium]|nr:site-specific DNA-methyltransferase [Propionibacteriaceae bacterium]